MLCKNKTAMLQRIPSIHVFYRARIRKFIELKRRTFDQGSFNKKCAVENRTVIAMSCCMAGHQSLSVFFFTFSRNVILTLPDYRLKSTWIVCCGYITCVQHEHEKSPIRIFMFSTCSLKCLTLLYFFL